MESEHIVTYTFVTTEELLQKMGDWGYRWEKYLRKQNLYPLHDVVSCEVERKINQVTLRLFPSAWFRRGTCSKVLYLNGTYDLIAERPPESDFVEVAHYVAAKPLPLDSPLVPDAFFESFSTSFTQSFFEESETAVTFRFYERKAVTSADTWLKAVSTEFLGQMYLPFSTFERLVKKSVKLLRREYCTDDGIFYKHLLKLAKKQPLAEVIVYLFGVLFDGDRAEKWQPLLEEVKSRKKKTDVSPKYGLELLAFHPDGPRFLLSIAACLGADRFMLRLMGFVLSTITAAKDDGSGNDSDDDSDIDSDCAAALKEFSYMRTQADSLFEPPLKGLELVASPPPFSLKCKDAAK